MNTNDGNEPCPTCNAYVPHSTLIAIREVNRMRGEVLAWRAVAAYYLGDMADTATPEECRREAFRRSTTEGE